MRLGLFGGTFDPPHYGHLVAAQEAAAQLELDRVLFMPAGHPPHKQGEPISPIDVRLRMVKLAIADNRCFELSLIDVDRPGPSYTADLLAHVRAEVGPDPELFFLVGMDSLRDLPTWHQPERVLQQCTLVAIHRPGVRRVNLQKLALKLPLAAHHVIILDTPGLAASSTDLRTRVAHGRSLRYLTPDPIVELIEHEQFYVAPPTLRQI